MPPLVITVLIVAGIFVLIAIAYISHMVEKNKLEKSRLKADLGDRLRRCEILFETHPGQLMTRSLKQLLSRLQLLFCERMLPLDKGNNSLRARIEELRLLLPKGDAIVVANPQQPIFNEVKAKEVRAQLESLHSQLTRCAKDGILNTNEA